MESIVKPARLTMTTSQIKANAITYFQILNSNYGYDFFVCDFRVTFQLEFSTIVHIDKRKFKFVLPIIQIFRISLH